MTEPTLQILTDAIARNCGVILSLPSAGLWRHYKSRFLSEDSSGIWIESISEDAPLLEELLTSSKPVGVSFRSTHEKIVLNVPLLRREDAFAVNAETRVRALLIARPPNLKSIQRRNNYRVRIAAEFDLAARIWRIAEKADLRDRPVAASELKNELRDLSVGGIGVVFSAKPDQSVKVSVDDRLRIEISYHGETLLLEGRMREPLSQTDQTLRAGIQFQAMQHDLEGRQRLSQLTRIVGELQREEVRRSRLGLAAAG